MSSYTSLKPQGYLPRLADRMVERALRAFGGIEIAGTRWCGKSWTAQAFAKSITYVDESPLIYEADPTLALVGEQPHVVDEWQDVPTIWNIARHSIDAKAGRPGQFIFTGSSTPPHPERRHSGAGRIRRIRLRTMTLAETGESSGAISLAGLFEGHFAPTKDALGLADLATIICRGGWPELVANPHLSPKDLLDDYLELLFSISVAKEGKSPELARRIARSLARNVATSATYKTIAQDTSGLDSKSDRGPSDATLASYLEVFLRNYVIDELFGWDAPIRSTSRLRTKPKRYFDDPSLAARLLGVAPKRLLLDHQLFGLLFESLCIHDLMVYASLLGGAGTRPLHYYADADGLEVDAIIELSDGRWAAIEIKLGEPGVKAGVHNLNRLRKKVALNPAAHNPKPSFMAVLLGKCEIARYLSQDDVYVLPIGALGP